MSNILDLKTKLKMKNLNDFHTQNKDLLKGDFGPVAMLKLSEGQAIFSEATGDPFKLVLVDGEEVPGTLYGENIDGKTVYIKTFNEDQILAVPTEAIDEIYAFIPEDALDFY